ncbi:MAG: hypothetical protein WKF75_04905 [Singulisphaera sp.]
MDHFEDLGDGKHVRPLGEISARSVSAAPPGSRTWSGPGAVDATGLVLPDPLNPNGKDQALRPGRRLGPTRGGVRTSTTRRTAPDYFPLTDGTGLQAFVVVASEQPLPTYEVWKAQFPDGLTWARVPRGGVWAYDNTAAPPTGSAAPPVTREPPPRALASLCERLRRHPGVTLVHALPSPSVPVRRWPGEGCVTK